MEVQASWLTRGFFQVGAKENGKTFTQHVREHLAAGLGVRPQSIALASFPVGPSWRFALWWREGDIDFAEAQFIATISKDYPVLSLGVSIEKGLEDPAAIGSHTDRQLDRRQWDWSRLLERALAVLERDVPQCSSDLRRPISVRVIDIPWGGAKPSTERSGRVFVYDDGDWYERHGGKAAPHAIVECLEQFDELRDHWVNVHFVCDLGPSDVVGISDSRFADMLLRFAPLRQRVRAP